MVEPVAAVVGRHRMAPLVMYRMFMLWDPASSEGPLSDVVPTDEELLLAAPAGVVFASARNDFYPEVEVEVWDAAAPSAAGEWDAVAEGASLCAKI
jgi:hypothetical protein